MNWRWELAGSRRIRVAAVCLLAGAGACLAAMLFVFDPATSGRFPPCPFHALTGLHCPGCGSLRGLHRLLHGDVLGAIDLNVFMVMCVPFVTYSVVRRCAAAVFGRGPREVFIRAGLIRALLAAIVVYAILRNIPVWPLTFLAP